MKIQTIPVLMLLALMHGRAADQPVITNVPQLDAIIAEVLTNNPALKAARANWEAMRERVPQARAWEDPRLGFDTTVRRFVDQPPNAMTDQKLMAEQTLPISGRNSLRGDAVAAEAMKSFEEYRRRELDTVAEARATYYRLANAEAQLELNRKNTTLLGQLVETTRAKYEAGLRPQADVLGAQTELAKLSEAAFDFQREISEAQTRLNVLRNRPPQAEVQPAVMIFQPIGLPDGKMEEIALAHRPEVLMAQSEVAAAQARLKAARREWIPEPGLRVEGDRYNAASQAVSEVGVGLSINLPWFNRSKYTAGIRENQKLLEGAQQQLESVRQQTLGMVRDQVRKVETFHHHTELFQGKLLPLAEQSVAAKRLSYETDKAGFLEVLDAQRAAQEVESMYWEHLMHYQTSVAELEALLGANPVSTGSEHHHETK